MLKLAAARLDKLGIEWVMLTGQVPAEKRPALLDRFRSSSIQVLLSSDAGGVGLNLQVANYVVHLDLPWNPARLDQRTSRAHRLGQTRGVSVTYLCSESGIERGIQGTLAGKRAVRSAALDADSAVEELDVQGFTVFLRQLQAALERLADPDQADREEADPVAAPGAEPGCEAQVEVPAEDAPSPGLESPAAGPPGAAPEGSQVPSAAKARRGRAHDRMRLAQVVLEAGFPGDAVKSAYDALAAAIGGLLDDPPGTHAGLVAAIYRELLPGGKLPLAVPGVLARLNDLASLERMGVELDPALARDALAEVQAWIERLSSMEITPSGCP
jgi:hypothetical protein